MATWWPIDTDEAKGRKCDACPNDVGLSRDDKDRIYCPDHRHLHNKD